MRKATFLVLTVALLGAADAHGYAYPDNYRYNEVRWLSTHNSYDYDGHKPNLWNQLQAGVRSFEIDIHNGGFWGSAPAGEWDVYHIGGGSGDWCGHLSQCLSHLRSWHDSHPNHDVITVWLDLKDDWDHGTGHTPAWLDWRIDQHLGGLIYSPVRLKQRCGWPFWLQESVENCGWPQLGDLRGKFIVVLMGDNHEESNYLWDVNYYDPLDGSLIKGNGYWGNKNCFVGPDIYGSGQTWDHGDAVFFNIDREDNYYGAESVRTTGFVSRMWKITNGSEWDAALTAQAHHIATDDYLMFNPANALWTYSWTGWNTSSPVHAMFEAYGWWWADAQWD